MADEKTPYMLKETLGPSWAGWFQQHSISDSQNPAALGLDNSISSRIFGNKTYDKMLGDFNTLKDAGRAECAGKLVDGKGGSVTQEYEAVAKFPDASVEGLKKGLLAEITLDSQRVDPDGKNHNTFPIDCTPDKFEGATKTRQ